MPKKQRKSVRLPEHVRPEKYVITIEPDLDGFTFTGNEEISLQISRPTRTITLHSAELEITSTTFTVGKMRQEGAVSYDDGNETATVSFPKPIPKGKGALSLSFAGILNDKMRGFYRSRYEHEGRVHHLAVTQFESTDARRAFPCFDEPAHKAVFEVSLVVPEDRTAISNTLETEVAEHRAGYKVVRFAPSPKMSSYLLAFIVGHFERVEGKTKRGTLVRVFTTPGKKHQAAFALDVAARCVDFYESYFGIRYPLPAMDLIAIPDFAAGAMENWGAVTYRETAILIDSEYSATRSRQRVALVIAHELAHQWFGNLVTMEWWTHLWLNEGFATYMEYVAIDALFPKWRIWEDFILSEHARALALDGLSSTHAIEIDVRHPQEISEIFDTISYAKGASILRMLAGYLGETAFRKGLRAYLRKHSYGNAETADLWRALEKASGKPVRAMMQGWTKKPGYPLVAVARSGQEIALTQQRFALDGARKPGTWFLPFQVTFGKRRVPIVLKNQRAVLPAHPGPVKANAGETAFARVRYSPEDLQELAETIKERKEALGVVDRFGIVRDAFTLSQAALLPTDNALKLAEAYRDEGSYIVWAQIAEQLFAIRSLLFGKAEFSALCEYARALLAPAAARIGWEKRKGESSDRALLRGTLIHAAGTFGDENVIREAKKRFWDERKRRKRIDPDLRASVYAIVAQNGGRTEYAALFSAYRETALEEEKDRLMRALCGFRDPRMLDRMLSFSFSPAARGQDTLKAIGFCFANPYGRATAWKRLKREWPKIAERFGGGHLFSRFITPTVHFTTKREADEVARFFKKRAGPGTERTAAQAIEQIRSHAAWYERDKRRLGRFLRERT